MSWMHNNMWDFFILIMIIMKIEYTIPGKTRFISEKYGGYKTLFTFTHLQEPSTKNKRYQVSIIRKQCEFLLGNYCGLWKERPDREFALFIKLIISHKRRQIGYIFIWLFFIIFKRTISSGSHKYETTCI